MIMYIMDATIVGRAVLVIKKVRLPSDLCYQVAHEECIFEVMLIDVPYLWVHPLEFVYDRSCTPM